jgi:hypothetical protein
MQAELSAADDHDEKETPFRDPAQKVLICQAANVKRRERSSCIANCALA